MRHTLRLTSCLPPVCLLSVLLLAAPKDIRLEPGAWTAHKVVATAETYKGRAGVTVTDAVRDDPAANEDRLLVLSGTDFRDGAIELELSGEPGPGAAEGARGFVGVAFRVAPDLKQFEAIYLRPTNGRAPDQVRRNRSVQYISYPHFPWHRLRKEFPEMYESYADLVPGEWTAIRIEVQGAQARLYVHGASQPTLVVNDLRLGPAAKGAIGLWIGPGTVAHFANVRVSDPAAPGR